MVRGNSCSWILVLEAKRVDLGILCFVAIIMLFLFATRWGFGNHKRRCGSSDSGAGLALGSLEAFGNIELDDRAVVCDEIFNFYFSFSRSPSPSSTHTSALPLIIAAASLQQTPIEAVILNLLPFFSVLFGYLMTCCTVLSLSFCHNFADLVKLQRGEPASKKRRKTTLFPIMGSVMQLNKTSPFPSFLCLARSNRVPRNRHEEAKSKNRVRFDEESKPFNAAVLPPSDSLSRVLYTPPPMIR